MCLLVWICVRLRQQSRYQQKYCNQIIDTFETLRTCVNLCAFAWACMCVWIFVCVCLEWSIKRVSSHRNVSMVTMVRGYQDKELSLLRSNTSLFSLFNPRTSCGKSLSLQSTRLCVSVCFFHWNNDECVASSHVGGFMMMMMRGMKREGKWEKGRAHVCNHCSVSLGGSGLN